MTKVSKSNPLLFFSLGLLILLVFVYCSRPSEKESTELSPVESNHPFLIVTKSMYPELISRAKEEPWASIKEDALTRAQSTSIANSPYELQKYIGAVALAYILDQDKRQEYAQRVKDAIISKYAKIEIFDGSDWGMVVPPLSSLFCAILALDIVYDALTPAEAEQCEKLIDGLLSKIDREGSWKTARYGTHGIWDIYNGNRTTPDDKYHDAILHQITPDGVSPVTNHYAWERLGGGNSRVSKSGYMDVLEFTGIDNRYYNNERIQKFMRWLFGSSINPSKEMAIFGDMLPSQGIANDMLHRRIINFDEKAAAYAAWFHNEVAAPGHILTYILPKDKLPPPQVPKSEIYQNGGAFFRDSDDDPNGLHAVLYNIKSQSEWHTHQEVNGLALSGLGNRILVNGGRLGAPTRPAPLNNTLTINGKDHSAFVGGGIVEGFVSENLDYAKGDSGEAMQPNVHFRNIILQKSDIAAPGYFIIHDQVTAKEGDLIKNYFHPASENQVLSSQPLTQYSTAIDHYSTVPGVSLTFYFLTPPADVVVEKSPGAVPDRYPNYPDHNRLESTYTTDNQGRRQLTTLIFPHNDRFPKPNFVAMRSEQYEGLKFDRGETTHYIFANPKNKVETIEGISFEGELAQTMKTKGGVLSFFVLSGTDFMADGAGFNSENPITIQCHNSKGTLITDGGRLTLIGKALAGVGFDKTVEIIESSSDTLIVKLNKGTYKFE
jgi:hypothetical protein